MEPQSTPGAAPTLNFTGPQAALGPHRRALRPRDQRWINDFAISRTLGGDLRPYPEEQEEDWYSGAPKRESNRVFTIDERTTRQPLGSTGLPQIDFTQGPAAFGSVIGARAPGARGTAPRWRSGCWTTPSLLWVCTTSGCACGRSTNAGRGPSGGRACARSGGGAKLPGWLGSATTASSWTAWPRSAPARCCARLLPDTSADVGPLPRPAPGGPVPPGRWAAEPARASTADPQAPSGGG